MKLELEPKLQLFVAASFGLLCFVLFVNYCTGV